MRLVLCSLCLLSVVACGAVTSKPDATDADDAPVVDAPIDAVLDDAAGDDAAIDAPATPTDAAIDAPSCAWIAVAQCDSGGTIASFCPSGTHVGDLRRCDGTTSTPDTAYQQFHLCNCTFQSCGCQGVAWQEVQCCN